MHVCLLLKAMNLKLNVQVTNILDARHDGVTCLSCFPTMCCPEMYICQSHLRLIHLLRLHSHVCCYVQFQIPCTSDIATLSLTLIEDLTFKWKYTFVYFRRAADHPMYMYVDFLQVHLRMHLFSLFAHWIH